MDHWLFSRFDSMQLSKVSEGVTWYSSGLSDILRSFNAFPSLSAEPKMSEWTFVWNESRSRDVKGRQFKMERYFSTNYEIVEALERDPERRAASKHKAVLGARLEHIVTCLQLCWQRLAARKLYMP